MEGGGGGRIPRGVGNIDNTREMTFKVEYRSEFEVIFEAALVYFLKEELGSFDNKKRPRGEKIF